MRERLADWRGVPGRQTVQARQILTKLLDGNVTLTPTTDRDGAAAYELRATFTLERFLSGILCPSGVASPAGISKLDAPPRVGGLLSKVA